MTFTTNQSNNDAFENLDLGEIEVGQTTSGLANSQNAIFSVQHNTGTDADPVMFTSTQGFRANDTGDYLNILQLLTREFLQLQTEPLEILQADVFSSDISPIKNLKYSINNDGVFKYYQFLGGTFKAQSETMSGEWFKISTSASVTVGSPDGINAGRAMSPSSLGVLSSGENINSKIILNQINENSLGTTNAAIQSGTATTQITLVDNTRAKIYSGQKIQITYADGSNSLTLTASSDVATSSKQIPVTSFTPELDYPLGCIVSPLVYDLTNVITGGGGGSTSPGGSDTQVQFNDGGSFGGTDLMTIGTDKVTFTGNVEIQGSNEKIKLNSGGDIIFDDDVNGGSGSGGILYRDSGGGLKFAFVIHPTNIVTICNRASNGEVQIRANTSSAGAAGELTIATFKDTSVDFLNGAELRGTNIGNIFDTAAYLTPIDFSISNNTGLAPYTKDTSDGATAAINSATSSMFASFQIPIGYEATHVQVNGNSSSSTFNVYVCNISDATVSALTSSPSVGTNQALSSAQSGLLGRYLSIEFTPGATNRTIYGAKITLSRL